MCHFYQLQNIYVFPLQEKVPVTFGTNEKAACTEFLSMASHNVTVIVQFTKTLPSLSVGELDWITGFIVSDSVSDFWLQPNNKRKLLKNRIKKQDIAFSIR
jgi:hypothetical protein